MSNQTLEQRKQAILDQINSMTHRQLVRFGGKQGLGMELGDYMKISKADLSARIAAFVATDDSIERVESDFARAFPQGLFHRGHKNPFGPSNSYQPGEYTMPEPKAPAGDAASQLAALIASLAGGKASVDESQVRAIVRKELEGVVFPVTVQVSTNGQEAKKLEGVHHRRFPQLLQMLNAGLNVWLAGPAGTGKTTAAHNAAEALGLPFYFNGAIDNEYKLLGFTDAQGRVVSRPFRKAYEEGGVYLFDEIDASMPSAVLAFNAALANGSCDFPDGNIKRHPNFRVIAAANTYGHGANAEYVGRARMDGAFLDRFVTLTWELDEALERSLAGNDKWVTYVQDVRRKVASKGIKVIISPRASIHGARMLAGGMTWEEAQESCLRRGMSDEQWNGVR